MIILLLGPPGSGKGTQGNIIAKKHSIKKFSTGDILRDASKQKTELGREIKEVIDSGKFISDELITKLLTNCINESAECSKGFILDGYPRTIQQARSLDKIVSSLGRKIDYTLLFEVEEGTLIKRISGRFTCAKCKEGYNDFFKKPLKDGVCDVCGSTEFVRRSDDTSKVAEERFKIYNEQTAPLIEYYKESEVLVRLDAAKEVDQVSQEIDLRLEKS